MNPFAAFYDALNGGYYRKMGRFFKRHIRLSGKTVLCLASGSGFFPEFYLRQGARRVVCVDISLNFLEIARKRLKDHPRGADIDFVHADMSAFETTRRFDLIFINGNSFPYLLTQEKQLACLKAIRRHLKPGGRAYVILVPLTSRINDGFAYRRLVRTESGEKVEERGRVSVDIDRHRLDFHIVFKYRGRVFRSLVRTRILTVPEFPLLARAAGLKVRRVWGDFRARLRANSHNRMYELTK